MAKTEPFDQYSDRYDAWFERHPDHYSAELEAIRQVLPPPPATGLEVGVGSGKFAVPLGIRVGVEPSEQMAVKAEKHGIRVFRNTAEHLSIPDDAFDFVLMVTTICFVDDIAQSFHEAFRVLKPHGCIVVGFVDKESDVGKEYIRKSSTNVFYRVATFFSAREVSDHLTAAGFADLTFRQTLIPGESLGRVERGFGQGAFVVVRGMKNG